MSKLYQLIGDIRYELANGIHSMGTCNRCNINSAKGGGICINCRVKELQKLVGKKLANRFYSSTKECNSIIMKMEDKVKKNDNRN